MLNWWCWQYCPVACIWVTQQQVGSRWFWIFVHNLIEPSCDFVNQTSTCGQFRYWHPLRYSLNFGQNKKINKQYNEENTKKHVIPTYPHSHYHFPKRVFRALLPKWAAQIALLTGWTNFTWITGFSEDILRLNLPDQIFWANQYPVPCFYCED